jgi:hypothetical protein
LRLLNTGQIPCIPCQSKRLVSYFSQGSAGNTSCYLVDPDFLLERPYKPVAGGNDAVDEICFIVPCKWQRFFGH